MKNKNFIFFYIVLFSILQAIQTTKSISKEEANDLEITKQATATLENIAERVLHRNKRHNKNNRRSKRSGLFEGDIVLSPRQAEKVVKDVVKKVESAGIDVSDIVSDKQIRKKRKIDLTEKLDWEFPILYFVEREVNATQIDLALKLMEKETCIRFKKVTSKVSLQPGLRYFDGYDCYSHIGKTFSYDFQDISISSICDTIGTIQHETMHALGSHHEQSRADRDDYVKIFMENVEEGCENNFMKTDFSSTATHNTTYDYGSDMQYRVDSFSTNDKPTMLPINPLYNRTLGIDAGLTFLDAKLLNSHYCKNICKNQIICRNGGYQDPNNCHKCKCIAGYEGNDCSKLPEDSIECRDSLIEVSKGKKYLYARGKKDCIYHIQSKLNRTLKITITDLVYYPGYKTNCKLSNSLEIKFLKEKSVTGALFCLVEKNRTIISEGDHVIVHHRSTQGTNYMALEVENN